MLLWRGRGLATVSRAQQRKREALQRLRGTSKQTADGPTEEAPRFSVLLKQLYKRTHPDLLRSRCAVSADHNDKQWQVLNGILSSVRGDAGEYPRAISQTMTLYLLGATLEPVQLRIQTAGGDCKRSLTKSFTDLFLSAKILQPGQPEIVFEEDYFRVAKLEEAGEDAGEK